MGKTLNSIKNQQSKWADKEEIEISSKGYCWGLEKNLFQNLDEDGGTRHDFEDAGGGELYGKMNAVHSSSALACNFFDYWRNREKIHVAHALGIKEEVSRIEFEKSFRTGLRGTPPHLDVVFTFLGQAIFAIESKFTEPYDKGKSKNDFAKSYFPNEEKLWEKAGLDLCQGVAEKMHRAQLRYQHLDAAQLLKHMLGLAKWGKESGKNWTLLYLWFNPGELGGAEAKRHKCEIKRFICAVSHDGKVGGGGKIRAMTYQELFANLSRELDAAHEAYRAYLAQRYFPEK